MSAPLANNSSSFSEPPLVPVLPPVLEGLGVAKTQAIGEPAIAATGEPPSSPPADPASPGGRDGIFKRAGDWLASSGFWAWGTSAVVHATLLVTLSLVILSVAKEEPLWVSGAFEALPGEDMSAELSEIPAPAVGEPSLGPFEQGDEISLPGERAATIGSPTGQGTTPSIGRGGGSGGAGDGGDGSGAGALASIDPLAPIGKAGAGGGGFEALSNPLASRGGGLEGRKLENRRAMALSGGGTAQSEAAVEAGLAWLAEHQYPDGGWRFDFKDCPNCNGYCRNPGQHTSTTAATGLALLSFLGAGYTHQEGKYQEVVERGLYYLEGRMTITTHGGDLRDKKAALEMDVPVKQLVRVIDVTAARRDSMYSHGIASLALVEAYAMTHDKNLAHYATEAVKFIVDAQYKDGGWRYEPNFEAPSRADMTVSGWQITVLKSATLAGIDVPYDIWLKIREFLDSIQDEGGSTYRYLADGGRGTAATTSIGLLCRMITGWPRDYSPLQRGVAKLGAESPQRNNMYFNYYASQVLHHMGGSNWAKWNPKMRDYLVKSQAKDGHEIGSWYFEESHSSVGGRLYTTAIAVMTLEVYYRHMPLYQESFVDRAP